MFSSKCNTIAAAFSLLLIFLISWNGTAAPPQESTESRPNIIIIYADDLGFGDIGAYGADKIPTPHIDKLAENGIRFTDAHSASALCSPSRYSILTGRYAWRTGLDFGVLAPFDEPLIEEDRMTVASMLKKEGYYTAAVGKWHLGIDWPVKEGKKLSEKHQWDISEQKKIAWDQPLSGGPLDRGFDNYYGINGSNNMFPYVIIEDHRVTQPPMMDKVSYDTDWPDANKAPNWSTKQLGARMTEQAVTYIHHHFRRNPDQPMFLYFPTPTIHRPDLPNHTKGMSDAGMRGDMVVEFDWSVGQIMDALKARGQYKNSLIIVTSDNGPRPGDPMDWIRELHGRRNGMEILPKDYLSGEYQPQLPFHRPNYGAPWMIYGHEAAGDLLGFKNDPWEGGHRVPFIVHWPNKIKEPRVSDAMINQTDLLATFANIVDHELPDDAGEDSYNMLPVLLGKNKEPVRKTMINISGWGEYAIRKGPWKLINVDSMSQYDTQYPSKEDIGAQLYNLDKDLGEQHNVIDQHPDLVQEMRKMLQQYKEQGYTAPRLR